MQPIKATWACLEHIIHVEMVNPNPNTNPHYVKHAHLGLTGCRNIQRSRTIHTIELECILNGLRRQRFALSECFLCFY